MSFHWSLMNVDLLWCKIIQNLPITTGHLISGRVDATRCSKLKGGFPPVPPALTQALTQDGCKFFSRLGDTPFPSQKIAHFFSLLHIFIWVKVSSLRNMHQVWSISCGTHKLSLFLIDFIGIFSEDGCLAPVARNWRVQMHLLHPF